MQPHERTGLSDGVVTFEPIIPNSSDSMRVMKGANAYMLLFSALLRLILSLYFPTHMKLGEGT